MNNTEILKNMLAESLTEGSRAEKVARAFIGAKGRFMTVIMKPNPEEDMKKRNGKVRVFHLNVAEQWLAYEKKHGLGDGILKECAIKGLRTKFLTGKLNVSESVHGEHGRFTRQCRCIDLNKVAEIRYGGNHITFEG